MILPLIAFLSPFLTVTQMVLLGIVLGLLWYGYRSMKKSHSFWKEKGISYVPPSFFEGNLKIFRKKVSTGEALKELYEQFPDERYHGIYQFSLPTLLIKDAELIKRIAVKEFDSFLDHRTFVDPDADPLFGKNLFATEGQKWKDLRSTLSPSFTSSKMKMMFSLMEECVQQFVGHLLAKQTDDVLEVEVKDIFSRYTNDVIASTAFGIKVNSLKDKQNEFYLMGKEASTFGGTRGMVKILLYTLSPFLAKLLKISILSDAIRDYFTNIIVDTMQNRKERNIIRPDMIHLMMEAQKERTVTNQDPKLNNKSEISTEDIVANAFVFFIAGLDTTSTFLTFSFYELAINPDVQSRLRNEINTVWKTSNGKVTYEALLGMKYLDMVVSEALRKWPPVILTDRKATKPYTIQPERLGEKPLVLEEGDIVWFPVFGIHRDPKFHPEPERFDPERFSETRKHEMDPFTFLPFGLGPRNCIGSRFALLEGKLLIFHILRSFEVVPIEKTKIPVVLDKKIVNLNPEGGMWLGFRRIGSSKNVG